jgi:hypothetical protein
MVEKHMDKERLEYHVEEQRTETQSPSSEEKDMSVDGTLSAEDTVAQFDKHETRRIMRKIDYRLIPLLAVLYL